MAINHIVLEELQDEEDNTRSLILETYKSSEASQDKDTLKLTGLDDIVIFLASRVVLPIAASFTSRVLYDKYKNMQTMSQAEQARQEIVTQPMGNQDLIDKQLVIEEISMKLLEEGISEIQAREIVAQVYTRLEQRYLD